MTTVLTAHRKERIAGARNQLTKAQFARALAPDHHRAKRNEVTTILTKQENYRRKPRRFVLKTRCA